MQGVSHDDHRDVEPGQSKARWARPATEQELSYIFSYQLCFKIMDIITRSLADADPQALTADNFAAVVHQIDALFPQDAGNEAVKKVIGTNPEKASSLERLTLYAYVVFLQNGLV